MLPYLPRFGVTTLNSVKPQIHSRKGVAHASVGKPNSNQNTADFHLEKCSEMHKFMVKNDHSSVHSVPLGKPSFQVAETTPQLQSPWPATRKFTRHKGSGPFPGSQPENAPNPWWHGFSLNEKLEMPPIPKARTLEKCSHPLDTSSPTERPPINQGNGCSSRLRDLIHAAACLNSSRSSTPLSRR